LPPFLSRCRKHGKKQSSEDGDDSDDDQQLNQRESTLAHKHHLNEKRGASERPELISTNSNEVLFNGLLDLVSGGHPLGFVAGEHLFTVDIDIKLAFVNGHKRKFHVAVEFHAVVAQKLVGELNCVRLVTARKAVCDANTQFRHQIHLLDSFYITASGGAGN